MLVIRDYSLFLIIAALLLSSNALAQKPVIEWRKIPAGTFIMGSPTSEPGRNTIETQHQVRLNEFEVSGLYEMLARGLIKNSPLK